MVETETASFWLDSPEVERGELRTDDIATEVFFFPAAAHAEKDGSFTNTQRLLQWHEKAVDPPGDARSEPWFVYHLGRRLKAKAHATPSAQRRAERADVGLPAPKAARRAGHRRGAAGDQRPSRRRSDRSLTGFNALAERRHDGVRLLDLLRRLPDGRPQPRERARRRTGRYGHGWGFAWPADRRILYNRASARPDGAPWSERKKLVWWDEAAARMDRARHARLHASTRRPTTSRRRDASGDDALRGDAPFIMHPDGLGWIWVADRA